MSRNTPEWRAYYLERDTKKRREQPEYFLWKAAKKDQGTKA